MKRGESTRIDATLYDTAYELDLKDASVVARVGLDGKYLFDLPVEKIEGPKIAILIEESSPLSDLTAGAYDLEVVVSDEDDVMIFPSSGYATILLSNNLLTETGEVVTTISLQTFESRFKTLTQEVETRLTEIGEASEGKPGLDGKSAYQLAQDDGFTGTLEEWTASLKGADGVPGKTGDPGSDGESAYQLAVDGGYSGTLDEWLASLKGIDGKTGDAGKDGASGTDGKSAYQIALDNGFAGTEAEWLASLKGEDGTNGEAGKDGATGADGKSAYEIAQANGFTGTETEWLASLKGADGKTGEAGENGSGGAGVNAIMSYSLDRTTTPWTIRFNNGTTLQFPTFATTATIYGYGYASNILGNKVYSYPLPLQVIQLARGSATIKDIQGDTYMYWADDYIITNPVQNRDKYDWDGITFGHTDMYAPREKSMIRAFYELGVLTDADVVSVGAKAK